MNKTLPIKIFSFFFSLVLIFTLFSPVSVMAIGEGTIDTENTSGCGSGKLCNPLRDVSNINQLVEKILDVVVNLGGYVAVFFIIWSGFLFVKAQGNPKDLETAKATLMYTLIGVAILLGAVAIQRALSSTIEQIIR